MVMTKARSFPRATLPALLLTLMTSTACHRGASKETPQRHPVTASSAPVVSPPMAKPTTKDHALTVARLKQDPEVRSALFLLEQWIRSRVPAIDIPGLSIAAAYDQEILWAKGFGHRDRDRKLPATPDTIYRLASITKLFTTTAILQLRDAGKLSLEDPVASHLPWFRLKDAEDSSHPIRIRHLLTHTSGLPRDAGFPYWATGEFPSKEQLIAALARQRVSYGPGVKWKYSNFAMGIAGQIVAGVSGQPYASYVQDKILDPLGMADSSLGLPVDAGRFALAYGPKLPGQPQRRKRESPRAHALGPAVDLCSTVLDLARFGMFQLRGRYSQTPTVGLDPITFGQMHRVHAVSESWKIAFGLGFRLRQALDTTLVGHGGAHMGFRSQLDISVDDRLVVVVAANGDDVEGTLFAEKALKLLAPHVRRLKKAAQQAPTPAANLAKYVGRYRNGWGDVLILVTEGRLVATYVGGESPEDYLIKLEPVAEHTFRIDDPFGGPDGELLTFDVDSRSGEVLALAMGGTPRKRLRPAP